MIGTSILTVYQGHVSKAPLKSSTDGGCWLRSLDCMSLQTEEIIRPRSALLFLRSELIYLFFLVPN